MFGKQKRFLRIEKTLINLDQVCMFDYRKNEKVLRVYFTGDRTLSIGTMEPDGFEKMVATLRHGKVKA